MIAMPKEMVLFITDQCSFRCRTCLRGFPSERKYLSLPFLEGLLPTLKTMGYRNIFLTGGEPCLHPQFDEAIRMIAGHGFSFGIVSNGYYYERYLEILKEHRDRVLFVAFSLDGANAQTHDAIRKDGSHARVIDAIAAFVNEGFAVRTSMCVNNTNYQETIEFVALGKRLGACASLLLGMIPTEDNADLCLTEQQRQYVIGAANYALEKHRQTTYILPSLGTAGGLNFCCNFQHGHQLGINTNHDMVFCCDTIHDGAVIGNLDGRPLRDLIADAAALTRSLHRIRADMIERAEFFDGFNTCGFCMKVLADRIGRREQGA